MMVMQKALIQIDHLVALIRGTLTIAAEFIEIIMPLLTHLRFLSQGARAVFRPYPPESHAFQMALDGTFMDLQSEGLFEECMYMLGMTDRSLPMFFKHQFTYLPFCG